MKKDRETIRYERELSVLREELAALQEALRVAEANYTIAESDEIIEAIIYDRAAAMARYSHLMKEIRRLEDEKAKNVCAKML